MKNLIKSDNSIKKITFIYLISLLPLILFGFYKNGISLYTKGYISMFKMFNPLLYVLIGASIGIVVNIIYERKFKANKNNIKNIIFSSFHLLYGVLIGTIISINTNILLFIIITFIILFISKFLKDIKFNNIVLTGLIIILITSIFGKFTFLNQYEINHNFNLNTIDYLFGNGSGGIATTNIILILLGYFILSYSNVYKKNIPIYSLISFSLLVIFYCIYNNNIANILSMIFTNGILFSFVFVSTDPVSSSYTNKGQIIYGSLIGIMTFLLYLIQPALSCLGAILICSIINSILDIKFE